MKPLPIPPGTYPLDSPEVAKLNVTPEQQKQICENVKRSAYNAVRKNLLKQIGWYVWDGAGV